MGKEQAQLTTAAAASFAAAGRTRRRLPRRARPRHQIMPKLLAQVVEELCARSTDTQAASAAICEALDALRFCLRENKESLRAADRKRSRCAALTALRENAADADVASVACGVIACSLDLAGDELVPGCSGAVAAVSSALRTHVADSRVVFEAYNCLAALSAHAELSSSARAEVVDVVVAAAVVAHPGNVRVHTFVCLTLSALYCRHANTRPTVAPAAANTILQAVLTLLQLPVNEKAATPVLHAMSLLLHSEAEQLPAVYMERSSAVVALLRHYSGFALVKNVACTALRDLADVGGAAAVCQAAPAAIVMALRQPPIDEYVLMDGYAALTALAQHGEHAESALQAGAQSLPFGSTVVVDLRDELMARLSAHIERREAAADLFARLAGALPAAAVSAAKPRRRRKKRAGAAAAAAAPGGGSDADEPVATEESASAAAPATAASDAAAVTDASRDVEAPGVTQALLAASSAAVEEAAAGLAAADAAAAPEPTLGQLFPALNLSPTAPPPLDDDAAGPAAAATAAPARPPSPPPPATSAAPAAPPPPAAAPSEVQAAVQAAVAPLQAALASLEAERTCAICLDAPRCVALLPCKHMLLCGSPACAAMLGAPPLCPLCRKVVADTLQLFV